MPESWNRPANIIPDRDIFCYKYTRLYTHELPIQRKRRSTTEGAIAEVGAEALLTRGKKNLLAVDSGHLHAGNSAP